MNRLLRGAAMALILGLLCRAFTPAGRLEAQTVPACATGGEPTQNASIRVDGRARTYLVHTPRLGSGERLPLLFAFHGRGETPELLEQYSRLSELRAIVVYPPGLRGRGGKLSWSGSSAAAAGVDDVHFVRAVFGQLRSLACADPTRAYATGKSDGGGLAAVLGCQAADIFRAIAPVAGAYYPIAGGCTPARPVAVLEFHGTADRVIPYTGSTRRGLPAVHAWLADWAVRDGCTRDLPSRIIARDVTQQRWGDCRTGVEVSGYRIHGGGHTWPGAQSASGPGATTQAIDATATLAAFLHLPS